MISTLVTRGTAENREKHALELCEKLNIHQYDRQTFSSTQVEEKGSSDEKFGIAQVRRIKKQALFKPAYSDQNAILILESQLLTPPAQQALLKLLEEPPPHTIIIMTVDKEGSLLPTISSRCQIIRLADQQQEVSGKNEEVKKFLHDADPTVGRRLEIAEVVTQNNPDVWVKEYIEAARHYMLLAIENDDKPTLKKISQSLLKAQEAYQLLTTTNANQKLIIEQLLLNI